MLMNGLASVPVRLRVVAEALSQVVPGLRHGREVARVLDRCPPHAVSRIADRVHGEHGCRSAGALTV
jgi:hypothetical protein